MQLNYKLVGNGPALIILHGLFGSLDNWQTLAKKFSEHYTVYTLDQRNHGKSPHSEKFSYADMADDLEEFMDAHGIIQANLIGHSMGGKTIMEFAVNHPERVEKMIVADMAPFAYPPHHDLVLSALEDFPLENMSTRKEAEVWMADRIPDLGTRQFLLKSLKRKVDGGFEWKFNLPVIAKSYAEILKAIEPDSDIETEVLFLKGGESKYLLSEHEAEIKEMFPNAIFEEIVGAGHWLHAEKPQEFYEAVLKFLR